MHHSEELYFPCVPNGCQNEQLSTKTIRDCMNNPQPYWSSHPIYAPGFLFFPLFAKVIMLWCGHVPAAAALCSWSFALLLCLPGCARQFNFTSMSLRGSRGSIRKAEQWSSSCFLHCSHFLCVHISDTCEYIFVSSP